MKYLITCTSRVLPEQYVRGLFIYRSGSASLERRYESLRSDAQHALPLLSQLHDAYSEAQKLSKFIVEMLYGAGNKAAAMLPCVSHMPRTEGCALYKKQMLCAAACAKMVSWINT